MEHRRSWHTSFRPFQVRSDAACRADDIGALAKKRMSAQTSYSRHFHTHTIFHTQLCLTHTHRHTYIHTCMHACMHAYIHTYTHTYTHKYIRTCILSFHIPSCFVTHHLSHSTLSHTTVLTFRSFTTSFPFPSFPVPATTFDAHYWKKLTCGVIRSFNFCFSLLVVRSPGFYFDLRSINMT